MMLHCRLEGWLACDKIARFRAVLFGSDLLEDGLCILLLSISKHHTTGFGYRSPQCYAWWLVFTKEENRCTFLGLYVVFDSLGWSPRERWDVRTNAGMMPALGYFCS